MVPRELGYGVGVSGVQEGGLGMRLGEDEGCELLLPGGERARGVRGSRYRVVLEGVGVGLVWDEGSRELGVMVNARIPDS